MTRSANIGSLVVLICGIALAFVAVMVGTKVALFLAQPEGFTPFFLMGGNLLAVIGLAVFAPLSISQSIVPKPSFGPFSTAASAVISLLCAAYLFGLSKYGMPVDLYGGSNIWALVLLAGIVPMLVASWNLVRTR